MSDRPSVAVFRPDDGRLARAGEFLEDLGVEPVLDPLLTVAPTGELPRSDGEYTILTSKTAADLLAGTEWQPGGELCAIGDGTASALREAGYTVDVVPETYSSRGLVEHLGDAVDGSKVEVARSDHGSAVLLEGLERAGAYVHETILYQLRLPDKSGGSTERAAAGELDGVLFTSSLTVEHFVDAAEKRGVLEEAIDALDDAVVGTIGKPTQETAENLGIGVDVVPEEASVEELAKAVVSELA